MIEFKFQIPQLKLLTYRFTCVTYDMMFTPILLPIIEEYGKLTPVVLGPNVKLASNESVDVINFVNCIHNPDNKDLIACGLETKTQKV